VVFEQFVLETDRLGAQKNQTLRFLNKTFNIPQTAEIRRE